MIGYTTATAFDTEVVNGIYDIACIVPAAGFLLMALALIFVYPLGKKKVDQNIADSESKKRRKEIRKYSIYK